MLTFLPLEQIDEMDKWEGSQLNTAKEILAFELTKLVHGQEEAEKAQSAARALFAGGGDDANTPSTEISKDELQDGSIDVISLLVRSELVKSRSDGRRAIEQGGVSIDGEKISDVKATVDEDRLAEGILLKKGKKNFRKITLA